MADYDSGLPVRTENDGDVVAKISDATVTSQQLAVEADGSINVNAAFAAGTKVRLTDGVDDSEINASGELQVRDDDANTLLGTIDADTSSIATDASTIAGDTTSIDGKTPSLGAAATVASVPVNIASDQTVPVSASSLPLPTGAATSANQLPDGHNVTVDNASGASAVNIQDGGNSITVDAVNLDIRDLTHVSDSVKIGDGTDLLAVNSDGSINVIVSEDVPGDEIVDYNTSAAIVKDASVNHDYTVTALKTFTGEELWVSGSGKLKAEVLVETAAASGIYNTIFVGFNSTSNPNISIRLDRMVKQVAGAEVRITITNRDNQAQDVYSTLTGVEN